MKQEHLGNSTLASIIIVTYNGSDTITDCLDSVKKLQGPQREAILVDNASTDDTLEKVKVVLPTACVLKLPRNLGYGGGCNAGASLAKGQILVFLNQDVRLTPAFLDKIVSRMATNGNIAICGGIVLSWDGGRLVSAGQFFERWTGYGLDYGFGSLNVNLRPAVADVFSPNGAAFAVRKDAFELIRGFREYFFLYFDETDLAWRARIAGFRIACCSDAIAYHKIDPTRAHKAWSRYYIDRNSLLSAVGNYELSTLIVLLPVSLMVRLAGTLILTLFRRKEHARSMARALHDFFLLLPRAWRQRDAVRTFRKAKDRDVMTKDLLADPRDVLNALYSSLLPSTKEIGRPRN